MVRKHLPEIFPSLLYVDDQDLLKPESELNEIIPLHRAFQFPTWPSSPKLAEIEPVLVFVHNILKGEVLARGSPKSACCHTMPRDQTVES